jgi:2,3-bisphosphoglycerate-independent phosphoglycerate mutase
MVGHTGVMEAAMKACETVDQCAEAVVKAGLKKGYRFIILADHGNADCMRNEDGSPNTAHTTQPVPCFLLGTDVENIKLHEGVLGDVAPTLLDLMKIEKPQAMSGKSLLV